MKKYNPPKRFVLNNRQLCDLEMLMNGGFSPLTGFLSQDDYNSVVEKCRLKNGTVWPLPIVLGVPETLFVLDEKVVMVADVNEYIELTSEYEPDKVLAKLHVNDIYKPDLEKECLFTLGTIDRNHPYAEYILGTPDVFYVGGRIEMVNDIEHYDFQEYRLTPDKLKQKIKARRWNKILGFQTRNPMHNCHFALSKLALSQVNENGGDERKGLVIQPVVGVTQIDDIDYHVRVRCYKHLLRQYAQEEIDVMLCLLPLSMRMAGPREALWHSLIRANYGCTHFVVGRDHAGPSSKTSAGGSFYKSYAAHQLINDFKSELPIDIIQSQMLVYSETLEAYTSITQCPDKNYKHLSGTELRRKLRARENIPDWFTMPEIAKELQSIYCKRNTGLCIYLIGLSGAGKTTISRALRERFRERFSDDDITLLDGDIIREHLGQGLGFSRKDRSINVRRIGYVAGMIVRAGGVVICANIAPYDEDRLFNRELVENIGGKYIEVHVNTSLAKCEERDVKGLYKQARKGIIQQFTGISDPFEYPSNADLTICGDGDINNILDRIEKYCF